MLAKVIKIVTQKVDMNAYKLAMKIATTIGTSNEVDEISKTVQIEQDISMLVIEAIDAKKKGKAKDAAAILEQPEFKKSVETLKKSLTEFYKDG